MLLRLDPPADRTALAADGGAAAVAADEAEPGMATSPAAYSSRITLQASKPSHLQQYYSIWCKSNSRMLTDVNCR